MIYLKKVSVDDIIGTNTQCDTDFSLEILNHYKEYELFLSMENINNKNWIKDVKSRLKETNARIMAVHCPKSLFLTSSDIIESSNYLSLIEVINDKCSYKIFEEVIKVAHDLSEDNDSISVILHAGSFYGCGSKTFNDTENISGDDIEAFANNIEKLLKEQNIKKNIDIVVENVTPYYQSINDNEKGNNTGWGETYLNNTIPLIKEINKKLSDKKPSGEKSSDEKTSDKKTLLFGLCIDFCHLITDYKLKYQYIKFYDKQCLSETEYIDEFFKKLEGNENEQSEENKKAIKLFHLSNLGDDYSHGRVFSDSDKDMAIMESVLKNCHTVEGNIPITLEMADGIDKLKACANFDRMMYSLSVLHKTGNFAEALTKDEELKEFFESMYKLYVTPIENVKSLQEHALTVKQFMLTNSNGEDLKNLPFGFTENSNKINLASLRVQAYAFYTRFCMLGKYLADVYKKADFLSDWKKDFCDSMKYFIFADNKLHQCVYTGIAYSFFIDMLPKKVTYYRFNDGIKDGQDQEINDSIPGLFGRIKSHIQGGSLSMFSVGKNFHHCMLKYGRSDNDCSLRVYQDKPINYFKTQDKKTMSIPAFMYHYEYKKETIPGNYKFNIDMSSFRETLIK